MDDITINAIKETVQVFLSMIGTLVVFSIIFYFFYIKYNKLKLYLKEKHDYKNKLRFLMNALDINDVEHFISTAKAYEYKSLGSAYVDAVKLKLNKGKHHET